MQHQSTWSFDSSHNPKYTQEVVEKHTELFVAFNKGKFGIVDPYFGWVIQPIYNEIHTAYKGSFWGKMNNTWQLFNLRSELICTKHFTAISKFKEDYAAVSTDGEHFGFIDKEGRFVVPPIYSFGRYLGKQLFAVALNNKYGVVDLYGRTIVPFRHRTLESLPQNLS